jgi:hypothetical protein
VSNLSPGSTGFGGAAEDCARMGAGGEAANAAAIVSAARERAMDMVRSGYGKTATATAIAALSAMLKSSGLREASKNKAR